MKTLQYDSIIRFLKTYGYISLYFGSTARDIYRNKPPTKLNIVVIGATFKELLDKFKSKIKNINYTKVYIQIKFEDNLYNLYPARNIDLVKTYKKITFEPSLIKHSESLDFTINSYYYNPYFKYNDIILNKEFIDFFEGLDDTKNKLIRFIKNPYDRIMESKVRMIRAASLVTRLGQDWKIDRISQDAIKANAFRIRAENSKEIFYELKKVLSNQSVKKPSKFFYTLKNLGLLKELIPELCQTLTIDQTNKNANLTLFQHTMLSLDAVNTSLDPSRLLIVRTAALFHDIGKIYTITTDPDLHFYQHDIVGAKVTAQILYRLGFPQHLINKITLLIENHLFETEKNPSLKTLKKLINKVGAENILNLIELRYADRLGINRPISTSSVENFKNKVNKLLETIAPNLFELNISDKKLEFLIYNTGITKNRIKEHLRILITNGVLLNKDKSINSYIIELLKIDCPLDIEHLLTIYEKYSLSPNTFKFTCGFYCNNLCETSTVYNKILKH